MPLRSLVIATGLLFIQSTSGTSQSTPAAEGSIRQLITTFAEARNAHDLEQLMSLYTAEGEFLSTSGFPVKGDNLKAMWRAQISSVPESVERIVQSIDLASPHLAVVHVNTIYPTLGRHAESFVLVKIGTVWRIRIHESY